MRREAILSSYFAPGSRVTLNEALRGLGLTTRPSCGLYKKKILRGDEVIFEGTAHDVTDWLREGGAG